MKMTRIFQILLFTTFIVLFVRCHKKWPANTTSSKISDLREKEGVLEFPRTFVVPLFDSISGFSYDIYIRLPENYKYNENQKNPVIFYTDALWHMEILTGATDYILNNTIQVGISWQTNIDKELLDEVGVHYSRFRDYSFITSKNEELQSKYQFGQAKKHLEFIENFVIKYVEENYNTDPNRRTYFGYSLGGVFGTYILFTKPKTFKNYIIGSPAFNSVKTMEDLLIKQINPSTLENRNIYISYGSLEKELGKKVDSFLTVCNTIDLDITFDKVEGNHKNAFPITVVKSLQWLSRCN